MHKKCLRLVSLTISPLIIEKESLHVFDNVRLSYLNDTIGLDA